MENIFVVNFKVESEAYQAMTEMRQDPVNDSCTVSQAFLVKKSGTQVSVLDEFDTGIETANDSGIGGLVGSLVGIVGGPLGILLGGSLGFMVGNLVDASDALDNASLIEKVCEAISDGETAMIALVSEKTPESFGARLGKFNADVLSFDAAEVAAEVAEAEELEREMQKEARKKLREEKKEAFEKKVDEQRKKIGESFENLKNKIS